jgi:hypothetical protein
MDSVKQIERKELLEPSIFVSVGIMKKQSQICQADVDTHRTEKNDLGAVMNYMSNIKSIIDLTKYIKHVIFTNQLKDTLYQEEEKS